MASEQAKQGLVPIPQPPQHLWGALGNLPDLDSHALAASVWKLAKLYGPIFKLNLLDRVLIPISTYELMKEVEDDERFHKDNRGGQEELRPFLKDGLFTAKNDEKNWGKAHRLLMPVFGPLGVQKMLPEMKDIASQMILKWDRLGPEHEILSSDDFTISQIECRMHRLAFDTIGLCGFGFRFNNFYSENMHPFAQQMADILVESGARALRTRLETQMRVFADQKYRANLAETHKLVDEVIEDRQRNPQPDRNDLLNIMLNAEDPTTGEKLDEENIRYQLVTFLVAGHETTSGTLSFLFYHFLNKPYTLMKAQKEVDEVLGDDSIEVKHLSKLKYIHACIMETLRFMGPISTVQRNARKSEVIGGKYAIEPENQIFCNLRFIHHDPAVWGDDAEDFKPERMLDMSKIPAGAFRPFGVGVRSCIGRSFAEQEMVIVTALILQRFQVEAVDPSYELNLKFTLTVKPNNFKFRVRRRPGKSDLVGIAPVADDSSSDTKTADKSDKSGKPLTVLYGSNAGTCKTFAEELQSSAGKYGYKVEIQTLDSITEHMPTDRPVAVVVPSYEGKPPDNAKKFCAWLEHLEPSSTTLKGVNFAVFGVGNNEWASTFHKVPKDVDALIEKNGGTRICESGFADIKENAIGTWEEWCDRFWASIAKDGPSSDDSAGIKAEVSKSKIPSKLTGEETTQATVVDNRQLADTSVGPAKKHLEVELPEGTTYQSGDYLVVVPYNPRINVGRVLKRFHIDASDEIKIAGSNKAFLQTDSPLSAFDFFATRVELANVATQKQIRAIAAFTPSSSSEHARLTELASDADVYRSEITQKRVSVLDLLEDYPSAELPLASYIDMLHPLAPRQYSISSSPLLDSTTGSDGGSSTQPQEDQPVPAKPLRATITYDVHTAPALSSPDTRTHHGVASTYLSQLAPGQKVNCVVRQTNAAFHLPANPLTPVIMVCAGTGVAPMRGFAMERAALAAARGNDAVGPTLLYFGCRDRENDYLYRDEWEQWQREGAVDSRPVFSRQAEQAEVGKHWKYVSDRMWDERDELRKLYEGGAKIFVCGSASKLAKSVQDVLIKIYREGKEDERSEEVARAWLDGIKEDRFVSDVFD